MCKESIRGGGGSISSLDKAVKPSVKASVHCCTWTSSISLTFQWVCFRFDGCFAISTISVFIPFHLVLSGLFSNLPLLLSFDQIFLFRHDSKNPFNVSSASHMCRHFLLFSFILFLHKHFCSSERAGIICALCFLRRACCRSTELITPAQWCRAVSAFQRGNWRE